MKNHSLKIIMSMILMSVLMVSAAEAVTVAYYRLEDTSGYPWPAYDEVQERQEGQGITTSSTDVPVTPIPQTGEANTRSWYSSGSGYVYMAQGDYAGMQTFILNDPYTYATLEFWIKANNDAVAHIFNSNTAATNTFVMEYVSDSPSAYIGLKYLSPLSVEHVILNPSLEEFTFDLDTWTHIAVTREVVGAEHTYRFYKDGTLEATKTDSSPDLPDATAWNMMPIGSDAMKGYLDEIRFSNEQLQPDQFLNAVPEPSTFGLFGIGGLVLIVGFLRRRKSFNAIN